MTKDVNNQIQEFQDICEMFNYAEFTDNQKELIENVYMSPDYHKRRCLKNEFYKHKLNMSQESLNELKLEHKLIFEEGIQDLVKFDLKISSILNNSDLEAKYKADVLIKSGLGIVVDFGNEDYTDCDDILINDVMTMVHLKMLFNEEVTLKNIIERLDDLDSVDVISSINNGIYIMYNEIINTMFRHKILVIVL